ncbi:Nn.00g048490.m01.CDS01 [Neocucurbitaria sp. VM-36]
MQDTPIPIVDFIPFVQSKSTQGEKTRIARELDDAFRNVGFVYLRNHGVSGEMVKEGFEWSRKFFALPLETKIQAPHPPGGAHHRGYSAPGVEKVPDYKESFESGNPNDEAQPNIWLPDDALPGFRPFLESYFTVCAELIHRILDALSIALKVPDPGLSPTHSDSLFQLRLLHYPAISSSELSQNKRSRINAHSDFGTLTLLFQDSVGGLEVEDPHQPGVFRAAEPIEDTVLVNIGDLMARWSNDRWRSTVHRVELPSGERQGDGGANGGTVVPDRYSIPVFATANMDAVVDALPGCWSEGNPKKYEPVTAWGYVQMRMAALYES